MGMKRPPEGGARGGLDEEWRSSGCGDLVLGAVAATLDEDGFDVMEEAVQEGGCEGGVVVEDLRPVFWNKVTGSKLLTG